MVVSYTCSTKRVAFQINPCYSSGNSNVFSIEIQYVPLDSYVVGELSQRSAKHNFWFAKTPDRESESRMVEKRI